MEAHLVLLAHDDVAAGTHRAWDHRPHVLTGLNRALPCHPHLAAEVPFLLREVVVAVDALHLQLPPRGRFRRRRRGSLRSTRGPSSRCGCERRTAAPSAARACRHRTRGGPQASRRGRGPGGRLTNFLHRSCATLMKWFPILLPTPLEPEWSVAQTVPSVSSASSMKWLPPPSVPKATRQFLSYWSGLTRSRAARSSSAFTRGDRGSSDRAVVLPGAHREFAVRSRRESRRDWRSSARVSGVLTAIIPQPISTPTAAGIIAPLRG